MKVTMPVFAAWKQGTLEDAVKEQIIESVTAELKA